MATITVSATQVRPETGSIVKMADAAEAFNLGDVVRMTSTGVVKANATTSAGVKGQIGIAVAGESHNVSGAVASGERVSVLWFGSVFLGQDASLDTTKQYFVGTTAGDIVDTVGAGYQRAIGYAESDTILFFNPDSEEPAS